MTSERPLILVSNDDGYRAEGNRVLREALVDIADVFTVAPELDQSAKSHSLSLHHALRLRQVEDRVFALDGTPADCVYVGLFHSDLLPRRPDLVVAGLNHGPNLGDDVHYSGTVAAAREGALKDIPAIAFSMVGGKVTDGAAEIARSIVERTLSATHPEGRVPLLNVNFPEGPAKGVRATRLGHRRYEDGVVVRSDPRGRSYLWIGGGGASPHSKVIGSDTEAVDEGFVSVTPLRTELSHPEHLGLTAFVAGAESSG